MPRLADQTAAANDFAQLTGRENPAPDAAEAVPHASVEKPLYNRNRMRYTDNPTSMEATMTRRKTAEKTDETPIEQPAAAAPDDRPPGDDPADSEKKANWQPRPVITEVLPDGSKARLIDGYDSGVAVSFENPPSAEALEPLKEDHPGRNKHNWKNRQWHKGVKNNPVAERLDAESRFSESVRREREAQAKKTEKTPF